MTKPFNTILLSAAALFALGVTPSIADSETFGANVAPSTRIQQDNTGTAAGTTVERLMQREEALKSGIEFDGAEPITDSKRLDFGEADIDNDGVVDQEEFFTGIDADSSPQSFEPFDKDENGVLDKAEYQAFYISDSGTEEKVMTTVK